jgi:thiamine-phosphate pyrophosphorylase
MSRLYLISPPQLDLPKFKQHLPAVLDAGDVDCFQLRLKDVSDDDWRRAAEVAKPICELRGVPLLLNDRADLVKETGADGVHLGREDAPYDHVRLALGHDKIIGVSCYASKDDAMTYASQGANYVAFGSVFPTTTKLATPVALSVLEDWAEMAVTPCVAIGGINAGNCGVLAKAGVDFVAVISAVWNYPDGPVAGATRLREALELIVPPERVSSEP